MGRYPLTLYSTVVRLVGPIRPLGDHGLDQERLANLKELTELIDEFVCTIADISHAKNSTAASVKAIGTHAAEFLESLREVDT